jgi:cytochrome c553
MKSHCLIFAVFFFSMALCAPGIAADKTPDYAARTCGPCHGPKGDSTSSAFPRLAGQQAAYIDSQLKAFRAQTRGDPAAQAYMWAMASRLDDQTIGELSAFYAAQKPIAGAPGDSSLMAQGKRIYDNGVAEQKVLACISCHGPGAEGKDNIPRLAGQHAPYLVKQLLYFQSLLRGNAPVMHVAVGEKMTMHQMEAVAAYAVSK